MEAVLTQSTHLDLVKESNKEVELSKFLEMIEMLNSYSDVIRSLKLSENVIFLYHKEDIQKLISDERFYSIEPLRRDIDNLSKIYSNKMLLDYFQILTEKIDKISSDFIANFVENFYTHDKLVKIEDRLNTLNQFLDKVQEMDSVIAELKEFKEEYEKENKSKIAGFNKRELILVIISSLLIISSILLIILTIL